MAGGSQLSSKLAGDGLDIVAVRCTGEATVEALWTFDFLFNS